MMNRHAGAARGGTHTVRPCAPWGPDRWPAALVPGSRRAAPTVLAPSNGWFRFDGTPDDMRGAIEELRKQMEDLEHRLGQQQHPKLPGGTEKI